MIELAPGSVVEVRRASGRFFSALDVSVRRKEMDSEGSAQPEKRGKSGQ